MFQYNRNGNTSEYCYISGQKNQYNRNGNTSEYCYITGQNISGTGMVILVSTAILVDRTSVKQEY
jgi:hypothetical protein